MWRKARVFYSDDAKLHGFTSLTPLETPLINGRWDPIGELLENADKVDACLDRMGLA